MNYTMSDVKKADRLYDQMPLDQVAEKMGIPKGTVRGWYKQDLIDTETDHNAGPRHYDQDTVDRVDQLYDRMPLSDIAEVLDIPIHTLKNWRREDWIGTDVNWSRRRAGPDRKVNPMAVVEAVMETEKTQTKVADEFGVCDATVSRYLKDYRKGNL